MSEPNDAEWVRESVVDTARETGDMARSGARLAVPVEGKDKIAVYRHHENVDG